MQTLQPLFGSIFLNSNLQQALHMSMYTGFLAIFAGFCMELLARYSYKDKSKLYYLYFLLAIVIGAYTAVSSMLWLYYFNIVLSLPAFFFLIFIYYKLRQIETDVVGSKIALFFILATLVFSILGAWFFGMFG